MLAVFTALTACSQARGPATPAVSSPELQQRIEALKAKTLKNLVFVEGGSFMMGDFGPIHSPEKLPYSRQTDDDVLHKVTLDSYSIGAYKVTYEEYDVYTDAMGLPRIAMGKRDDYRQPNVPAGASWQDARNYCQWIGKQLNLPMDLPTEAQWEYAARSRGKMVVYATDNGKVEDGRNVANDDQREEYLRKNGVRSYRAMPVGLYPPNPIGLYDLITNGKEWAVDWYADDYYEASPEKNPEGPGSGTKKVMRGYSSEAGDNLINTSMTFTRQQQPPELPERMYDGRPTGLSQYGGSTLRCVAKSTRPVR